MKKKCPPQTSIDAFHSLDPEKISQIQKDIVMALRVKGPMTYEQIASHLKKDPSRIWKRMSEGHRMGIVERTGERRKMASGRDGFIWKATDLLPITEKAIEGKAVVDFSRALIQPNPKKYIQDRLF